MIIQVKHLQKNYINGQHMKDILDFSIHKQVQCLDLLNYLVHLNQHKKITFLLDIIKMVKYVLLKI